MSGDCAPKSPGLGRIPIIALAPPRPQNAPKPAHSREFVSELRHPVRRRAVIFGSRFRDMQSADGKTGSLREPDTSGTIIGRSHERAFFVNLSLAAQIPMWISKFADSAGFYSREPRA